MTRCTLRFGSLRIGVASADTRDLVWLREFLRPAFASDPDGDVGCAVRLTVDADRHQGLQAWSAARGARQAACFALDTRMVSLPSWALDGGARLIRDAEYDVFYLVREAGADIEILGRAPDLWRGRIPLLRVVRELAMNHAIADGGVLVHGAGIRLGGQGMVLAGPRRAGKTTMLTWLLGEADARYVANDRVIVRLDDGGAAFRGVPTIVTLRVATARRFPRLGRRVGGSFYNPCLSLREVRARVLGRIARDEQGRYHMSPAQYLDLTGARPAGGGRLRALVFPRVTHRRGRLEVRRLTATEAVTRLRASLFRAAAATKASDVFAPFPSAPRRADALVRRVASTVPCFECRAGSQAYADRRDVARVRAGCL